MFLARHSLRQPLFRSVASPKLVRGIKTNLTKQPPLVFAFDIDGVLIQGEKAIPAAKRAFQVLDGDNLFGQKIPYILLTNGGGIAEEERCRRLTKQLGVEISPKQYIQAHTILRTKTEKHANNPVLVLGGINDEVQKVATSYGYKRAYTPLDVLSWNSSAWPFHHLSPEEKASTAHANGVDFSTTQIQAAFVFHDPRNWALDVQILLDVIQSGGFIGGPAVSPENRHTELVFCNPDLIWRTDFPRPRIGQGAFRDAFQAVYKSLNGHYYPHTQYGKPTTPTYQFAEEVLTQRLKELYGPRARHESVYMIGDNPESDIAGANRAGWSSVLVHTGVYDPTQGPPPHSPTSQAVDVEAAVQWAIKREFGKRS